MALFPLDFPDTLSPADVELREAAGELLEWWDQNRPRHGRKPVREEALMERIRAALERLKQ
jgi:hypothetical protein